MGEQASAKLWSRLYFHRGQLLFALFILLPYFIEFVLPLIFYNGPIFVGPNWLLLENNDLWRQFYISLIWFLLVFLVLIFPTRRQFAFQRDWSVSAIPLTLLLLTIVGALVFIVNALFILPASIQQITFSLSFLPPVSIVIIIYCARHFPDQLKKRRYPVAFFASFNFFLIFSLPVTSNGISFFLADFIGILYVCYQLRLSVKWIAGAFLVLFFFMILGQSGKLWMRSHWREGEFIHRESLSYKAPVNNSPASNMEQSVNNHFFDYEDYKDFVKRYHVSGLPFESHRWFMPEDYLLLALIERLSDQGVHFAVVINETPGALPYWGGSSYERIPQMLLPRILFPKKPIDDESGYFGRLYGITAPVDHYTRFALGGPIEAWINAGWWGIILTSLIYGFILRLIWLYFIGAQPAIGNLMLATVIVINAGRLESDALIVLGNLLHVVVVFWLLDLLIRRYLSKSVGKKIHR